MPGASKNQTINEVFQEFWEWRLRTSPEFATTIANHNYDDLLDSYDLKEFPKRKKTCQKLYQKASVLLENTLEGDDELNLMLFQDNLRTYSNGMKYEGYLNPVNYLEGVHIEFERLVSYMVLNTEDDYLKLIKRVEALPQQIQEIMNLMKQAVEIKRTNHKCSMEGVVKSMRKLASSKIEDLPFYAPFLNIPDTIPPETKTKLKEAAEVALKVSGLPAFSVLADFIDKEYNPHTRPGISLSSVPDGTMLYQQCLMFHLGLEMTPLEVHSVGLKEVQRISTEMDEVIKTLNLTMSRQEFSEKIRTDPAQFFSSKEELLDSYKNMVNEVIAPKLHKLFHTLPKQKLEIVPTPDSMSAGPQAYYLAGSPDGSRPGTFYVNTANLKASPKYEMATLSLHEGLPGHHLQIAHLMEQDNLPDFRRFLEDRKYSDAPSRFPLYTAYIEGWGLYSEYLGYELGVYTDPYTKYGHLSQEIFRACRLVVDTGMHALEWTREDAVQYMLDHSAATKLNIEKEVNRYITWPGQALAYKVGELTIKKLRQQATQELGDKFDIRDFHEVVLKSTGPLSVLKTQVELYITNNKNNKPQ